MVLTGKKEKTKKSRGPPKHRAPPVKGKKPAVVKKAIGFSATKLNAALKLIENQEIKDKRKLETFKNISQGVILTSTEPKIYRVLFSIKNKRIMIF